MENSVFPRLAKHLQKWKKAVTPVTAPVLIFHSCANFWFLHAFLKEICIFVCNFWHFCLFLHNFERFLQIFYVLIVQAQS